MTYEKVVPAQTDNGQEGLILKIGGSGAMRIMGGTYMNTEEIPVTDPRLQTAWKHTIYRTLIEAEGKEMEILIW